MGNVQMNYRASRGSNEAGDEITDARDAFSLMFENDFPALKAMYDGASAADKASIDKIFDGNIFGQQSEAKMWLECNDDPDALAEALEKVKPFISR